MNLYYINLTEKFFVTTVNPTVRKFMLKLWDVFFLIKNWLSNHNTLR